MDMNAMNPLSGLRGTLNRYVSGVAVAAVLGAGLTPNVQAADNRVPSFWGGVSVKVTETYGNNNTKPLTGVKVILDLKDPGKAAAVLKKYPVIKFPMVKTAGTRGANFTRIPPTKDVGEYTITVIPKPNDVNNKYACTPYPGKRGYTVGNKGEVTESFRMGTGGTSRKNYGYKCPKAVSVNRFNQPGQGGNNQNKQAACHEVQIQARGSSSRYGYVKAQSCKQSNGYWKIEPYKYKR